MSMNAMAVVGIEWATLHEALGEAEAPAQAKTPAGAGWLRSLYGGAILVHRLEDGVVVDLGHAVGDVEPEELGAALRAHLGPLLDAHEDERGVFVFPEKARGKASTVAALIEEVGELGEWVPLGPAAGLPGMGGGLEAMMGQMLGGMDPAAMQGLMAQAQQMMADPEMAERMMAAAAQMLGSTGGGLDLSELAAQAQRVVEDDPELAERLAKELGKHDEDE
jgi:hypothetical protein